MNYYYQRGAQRFGPLTWDAVVAAARNGTIAATDLIWQEGWPAWRRADSVPGLGLTAPPLPQPRKALGDDAAMRMILPVGRSGWAIAAGYLGLFAVLIVFAPFALAAGIFALRDIRKHPEKHGKGRAIFGIIMGALGTTVLAIAVVAALLGHQ